MKSPTYKIYAFAILLATILATAACKEEVTDPATTIINPVDTTEVENTTQATNTSSSLSGELNALFVGHSAMNFIVDDYVKIMAEDASFENSVDITTVTASGGLSLESKYEVEEVAALFNEGTGANYDFVVLTEQWDYQWYTAAQNGEDTNSPVSGCPPDDYQAPDLWINPNDDWMPTPYALQQYTDAIVCANSEAKVFYYQTWSLGYNEVENGDIRSSDQNFSRPSIAEINALMNAGNGSPDLPLADRIEFEGVKWENFVVEANRPDIIFIPAGYGVAKLMRAIEAGTVPGFEAVANTGGLTENGVLAWRDYIFYQDQYHAATVGHYFLSLVIYASVFQQSPEGLPVGSEKYLVAEAFSENQYELEEISDEKYQQLLDESGAKGIYGLRGYGEKDYMHESLKVYLQRLAWEVVQTDSDIY